jgi:hypothetical protein
MVIVAPVRSGYQIKPLSPLATYALPEWRLQVSLAEGLEVVAPADGTRAANVGGPETSVRRRFSCSSRTSCCLPVWSYLGCRNVKNNGRSSFAGLVFSDDGRCHLPAAAPTQIACVVVTSIQKHQGPQADEAQWVVRFVVNCVIYRAKRTKITAMLTPTAAHKYIISLASFRSHAL